MDEVFSSRFEELRRDFETVTGRPFSHFYCPILHRDEETQLCRGHVVPAAFGSSGICVPQRKDVDNFYGTIAEAPFVAIVQDRGKTPAHMWLDRDLRKKHRPRLEFRGEPLSHYFPKTFRPLPGHTPVEIVDGAGQKITDVVLKLSLSQMMDLHGQEAQIVVDHDYRAAAIASLLKAAHLSMFDMLGYAHVFSPCGTYLAHILRTFYESNVRKSRAEQAEALETYFRPLGCMISPMIIKDASVLQGTVTDKRVLVCVGSNDGFFAVGLIVRFGTDTCCVFLPTSEGRTIDTYFSFLCEPPPSIAVRLVQFVPGNSEAASHWETGKGDPLRVPLVPRLP